MTFLRFSPRLFVTPLRVGVLAVLTILLLGPLRPGRAAQESSKESPGRLVTASGDAIQTQGAWRLDGRRVIYTDSRGRLASIRTSEVDLDRSLQPEQLAAQGKTAPGVSAAPSVKAPALVIEDGDVGQWSTSPTALAETTGAAREGDAQPPAAAGSSGIELVSWKAIGDQVDRVVIHGTVRNPTRRTVREIRVRVVLLDERGEEMRSLPARMVKALLPPGQTSNFQARFGEFVPYSSVDFLIEGNA